MAFGPEGEIWFGATRFQPAQVGANSATYEMQAMDYSWGSWSGCQSHSQEITIAP
jgi:hypothetical protein